MYSFDRKLAKEKGKAYLKDNPYVKKLYLVLAALSVLSSLISQAGGDGVQVSVINGEFNFVDNLGFSNFGLFLSLVTTLMTASVLFKFMDIRRNRLEEEYNQYSVKDLLLESLFLFRNTEYILPFILTSLVSGLLIITGLMLLVVPGVLLSIGLSRVAYLVKDVVGDGNKLSLGDYLRRSFALMKGYYGAYFVLLLSFIGWEILSGITFGLLDYFVLPYKDYVLLAFHDHVSNQTEEYIYDPY